MFPLADRLQIGRHHSGLPSREPREIVPLAAAAERVNADYKDGIITVHVGRNEAPRPKAVEVKVN